MSEFFMQPNVLAAIPVICLGILAMRAFRQYAFRLRTTAVGHLGSALFWLSSVAVGRAVWWDVLKGVGFGISINWVWNILAMIACYHALRGFYLLIPQDERDQYNMITAVFYPRRLWRRLHDEDDIG